MSARNPEKVVEAACAGAIQVAGLTLRPFTLGLFPVLQKIDSPLLAERTERRKMGTEDVLRLILCLTIPPAEARALVAKGLAAFDEAALALGDSIRMDALPELGAGIMRQFSSALATAPGGTEPAEGARKKNDRPGSGTPSECPVVQGTAGT